VKLPLKTSSFLTKKEAKNSRRPPKTPKILSSPPAWIRKIFHILGALRSRFTRPRLTGINRKMPQLGILPKLIFRGNFASSDFLSQSLISFAQGENRGLVSSLKNQLLLMPMLSEIFC
jgi:hypothetical protein